MKPSLGAFVFELHGGLITRICLYQETQEALEAARLSGLSG